ncbi:NADH:flavin oxidoreductase/NADH oxidase [Rhodococcus pyridinivorans]|uniref:NADH:flavin oxidoreductase/NADH oxidase n=1 Tax=Rhodococcus pyridinivorans TaxID=103816 RepID=UPI00228471AD|nr:NADH:flavin oxidoreductase/NADH oxidase [Rhodococcus pyridinivorans]WAL49334.1 NADH:flavin oxidoreductase/NADH oxidase [Rhodococcus pyridinivorans]
MIKLFEPLTLRDLTLVNRAWMSPMCQYSAEQTGPWTGAPNEWHHTHLVSRAIGGAGLIVVEATAVSPEGRTSPADLGIWNSRQADAFAELVHHIEQFGSVAGIQLNHAGRKGSSTVPWHGKRSLPEDSPHSWPTLAPSAVPFGHFTTPRAATKDDIAAVIDDFRAAAARACTAGFKVLEIHAAHGYLIHQFLSPQSNFRTDEYGGCFDNRIRLLIEVVDAVRKEWPAALPLFVRLSATDWLGEEKGTASRSWTPLQSVLLAQRLREHGVDLIDVSTGGNSPDAHIPIGAGYQVPFAARIQHEAGIPTAAVGMITDPDHAEKILSSGDASAIFIAREMIRDPYWPRRAARALGADIHPAPAPYRRAM